MGLSGLRSPRSRVGLSGLRSRRSRVGDSGSCVGIPGFLPVFLPPALHAPSVSLLSPFCPRTFR